MLSNDVRARENHVTRPVAGGRVEVGAIVEDQGEVKATHFT